MPVDSNLSNWSVTESANYPSGSDIAEGVIDNALRQIQATARRYLSFLGTSQAASALNLASMDGSIIEVTGSGATITSLGTVSAGTRCVLRFQGANTIVHGSNILLPGSTNVLTSAGDIVEFTSAGSGVWWCTDYQSGASSVGGVPVGAVVPYAGTAAPSGYLLCFGQSVSRATYPGLFASIGTTYGAVDGSSFTIPDLRGRTMFGKDDMGGSAASRITSGGSGIAGTSLGAVGGAQSVTLTESQIPTHAHTQQGTFTSGNQNADHTHTFGGTTSGQSADHTHGENGVTAAGLIPGGSAATYWSYAATNTSGVSNDHSHTYGGTTSGISANHGHQVTISGGTATTGGGQAHVNMPPAMVVNYLIRF